MPFFFTTVYIVSIFLQTAESTATRMVPLMDLAINKVATVIVKTDGMEKDAVKVC